MKRYVILYRGVPAFTTNVHSKAKSKAWELATIKGWNITDLKIIDTLKGVHA